MKPTKEEVVRLFDYDPTTGIVKRRVTVASNARTGQVVGWLNSDGYLSVRVNKTNYKLHQIIWLYSYGCWQNGVIDHINRNKTDNRIANLRDTTIQVNNINKGVRSDNKTGVPNIAWRERDKLFYVACRRNGKQNYGGSFKSLEEARVFAEKFVAEIGRTK